MQNLTAPLNNGYHLNINEYFGKGVKLMNAQVGTFIGMTLLYCVIVFAFSMIQLAMPNSFSGVLNNIFSTLYFSGYFIYCRNITLKRQRAEDFFKGFYYVGNIILYLITYLLFMAPLFALLFIYIIPIDPFIDLLNGSITHDELGDVFAVHLLDGIGGFLLMLLLIAMVGIYLTVSYIFVIPLIVDARLGFWQAMELSRRVVAKKFLSFFIYLFLAGILIAIPAVLTCGLALLFLLPLFYCIVFAVYDGIFQPYADEVAEATEI